MEPLLKNENVIFNFNPFSGINTEELSFVLEPNISFSDITSDINDNNIQIIELSGKKGRGKTSHLKILQRKYNKSALILLNANSNFKEIEKTKSQILFIDSIHHLKIKNRINLFKSKQKIVLTTHLPRFLEYKLAHSTFKSYNIKGIDLKTLNDIISNRISIASDLKKEEVILNQKELRHLINKFNDDYRAILNYLYDKFTQWQVL